MKRKCNLFYNSGPDSKFLTFSNYTELMTGNYLSTNTKLFPSMFLCLDVPSLKNDKDGKKKKAFIEDVLIRRYENKLAFLRDMNKKDETVILPTQYLLEYLQEYDKNLSIQCVGNITEQDYNGIFSDIICVIDTAYIEDGTIIDKSVEFGAPVLDLVQISTDEIDKKLYGWYDNNDNFLGPDIYNNIEPIFDQNKNSEVGYRRTSKYDVLYKKTDKEKIVFNVVIPLFSMVNTELPIEIDNKNYDEKKYIEPKYNTNVPLGIWFADRDIILESDEKYGQSWSLTIGAQFKPLPTSETVKSDIYKTGAADAYNTFAQALINQNKITESISTLIKEIGNINNKITLIEQKISNIINNPGIKSITKPEITDICEN